MILINIKITLITLPWKIFSPSNLTLNKKYKKMYRIQFKGEVKMQHSIFTKKRLALGVTLAVGMTSASQVIAQGDEQSIEEVLVTGVKGAQISAINAKRDAQSIIDSISAEDIGKLPDVTVADSLQRIPGIQIQRDAGEGATVNVRGLPQVRTLINGEQMLTAGNIGTAQPDLRDIPSQLIRGVDVYKSTDLSNKRSGLTGTIDLKTWRPLDFDEGLSGQVAAESANGEETSAGDTSVNGLINWNSGTVGVMVSAATSEANLGNNYAGTDPGGVIPSNDWGGYDAGTDLWAAPHGFESFNRVVERERDAVNAALQVDFENGFKLTAEAFHTDMVEHDRKVGLNISNRWQTLNWLSPAEFTDTGVANTGWSGGNWLSTEEYDVDALWVNSFTVNRTRESQSDHYNLELDYESDNWHGKARYIHDKANFLSMNGQSQGDLSNWDDNNTFQLAGQYPFYPADIAAQYDEARLSTEVGENGGRFIEPNPLGYGENPQLHIDISGNNHVWTGFDTPIQGGLGAGATLTDYMANVGSYAIGAFSSEGNQENSAENEIFSLDGGYDFDEPAFGFVTNVDAGVRASNREAEIRNFHLFSDFYVGVDTENPDGCAAQWKAIDVVMNNDQCPIGENINGEFQAYTVNRPTRIDEFNNVIFVEDYGSATSGLPGVWAADPKDYDDVVTFHNTVFGGANRVTIPGNSYDVELKEFSYYFDADFEFEGYNVTGSLGARYIETEVNVRQNEISGLLAYGDTAIDTGDVFNTNEYDDLLPALNLAYRPSDDWTFRLSASKNMIAHDLGTYGGGLVINTGACEDLTIEGGRCVTGANEGGNPMLEPWRTENLDVSAEYYIGEASMFNFAAFKVDIESFTAAGLRRDSFPDSDGVIRREVDVNIVELGEGGEIKGWEAGAKLAFSDFTDGALENFGLDVNYTRAPSDSNDTGLNGEALPFPDNSEEQYNIVGWYQDDKLQARLAYNYRSDRYTGPAGGGVAGFQDGIGYLDAQLSYSINDDVTAFINGSNITGEEEQYYLDFGDGPKQFWKSNEFEARYTMGIRAKF
jgi:iron complex outermembrane receptor protein